MSAQEQYERYAHISRQLSLNSNVTDDPIAAERGGEAVIVAQHGIKKCQAAIAMHDNLSQEVDLNASDDDKEEELFGYTHSVYFHKMDHLIRGGMIPPVDLVQHIIQLCPDSASMTTDHGETALGLACNGFVPACEVVIQALVKAFPSTRNLMSRNYHVDPSPSVSPNIDNYKKSLQIHLEYDPSQDSKSQFLRDLLHFPKNLLVVSFEKEHTRRVLNDICGRGPYVALLMADFYIQLMTIISFTIGCNYGFKGNGSTTPMLIGSAYWIFRRFASAMGSSSIIVSLMYESWRLLNLLQAFVLMSASIYLRNNGIDLLNEEGVSGTWRNILILTSGLIWLNLLGIVCHIMKGFSVFVYATTQNRKEKKRAAAGNNNDESPIKTDWFVKFVTLQRGNRLIVNLSIVIIMLLWIIAGLCTLGLVWPRHIRRKIFTPTTTDHIKTDDNAEIDELLQMKEENME
ncbi:hypothetical protein QTG54_001329 [Skeletonema marinoi]|uniref:Uncharacterized protein n=1 Tax=Skeletonema marinoi TaxID=267567 RepID=A0AAD8YIU6_9STRA|nr:hypothetical protein QTG54_001329 [Skeletonema marinoi]